MHRLSHLLFSKIWLIEAASSWTEAARNQALLKGRSVCPCIVFYLPVRDVYIMHRGKPYIEVNHIRHRRQCISMAYITAGLYTILLSKDNKTVYWEMKQVLFFQRTIDIIEQHDMSVFFKPCSTHAKIQFNNLTWKRGLPIRFIISVGRLCNQYDSA